MSIATVRWSQGTKTLGSKLAAFVPKLVGFFAVLIIGIIVAKIVRKIFARILHAANVDQLVERSGFGRQLKQSGVGSASSLLLKVIYYGLVLLVLQLAIGVLGPNPVSNALTSMMSYIPKLVVALIILFVTGIVADKVGNVVRGVTPNRSYGPLATKVAVASIWLIGGFAALDQLQVARNVVDTLFRTVIASLGAIFVIKFGVGGIWAARDRFWPRVYDAVGAPQKSND